MSRLYTVLVVDDDPAVLRAVRRLLPGEEFRVDAAERPSQALDHLLERPADVALVDLLLPEMDGLALLRRLRAEHGRTEVILMSGAGRIPDAVAALRAGARDFLQKPLEPAQLLCVLREAVAARGSDRPGRPPGDPFHELIGDTPKMREVFRLVESIGPTRTSVLFQGESGTGKELLARALHACSGKPSFVAVNCASLPEGLLEAELFGHTRGAFTGAQKERQGLFEMAHGGTLFLDEIGDISPALQVKLLRAVQYGEVRPIGSNRVKRVDVRLCAATGVDLLQATRSGRFREDLYYRLAVITLTLPPLRERPADIPRLARYFLQRYAERNARTVPTLSPQAERLLLQHRWPGNVRELENMMERAVVLCEGAAVIPSDLPPALRGAAHAADPPQPYGGLTYQQARALYHRNFERDYLGSLLRRTRGNVSEAARRAGLDRANLRRILRHCGLWAEEFRD